MAFKQIIIFAGAPEYVEQITVNSGNNISTVLVDQRMYLMTLNTNGYFLFGGSTATVTSTTGHYLAAGEPYYFHADINVGLYVAVTRDSADGIACISRVRG